jgi:thiamine transporter
VQVLFDYPLPFMALSLAGFFRQKWLIGVLTALIGRFLCHFISGVVFFASYAPDTMSPVAYSLMVNGIFMGIEGAICVAIIAALPVKRLKTMLNRSV